MMKYSHEYRQTIDLTDIPEGTLAYKIGGKVWNKAFNKDNWNKDIDSGVIELDRD